jgi:putative chitinase
MSSTNLNPFIQLQRELGLKPDGIFGKNSLLALTKHFNLKKESAAHFFAQLSHETNNFRFFEENLNYSKEGLLRVFRKYFDNESASQYARKPQMIANRVYANRMGNGDEGSGDGWLYRGRGAIQLTGRTNYVLFGQWLDDMNVVTRPDLVKDEYSFDCAIFFFDVNNLWRVINGRVDDTTITALTRRINGGTNGLAHRRKLTYEYYRLLS